jgi:hypothetical protein
MISLVVFTLDLEKKRGQEILENLIFLVKNGFCRKTIVTQKYIETICCQDNFVFKFNNVVGEQANFTNGMSQICANSE